MISFIDSFLKEELITLQGTRISFNRYSLITYYVPGIILKTRI